jgi:hypothetical protein
MNIKTLKECLPYMLKAKITPWLWGHHGKGKSQTIENIFEEMGWLCFNFRLGTQADVGDLLGQSEIEKDPITGQMAFTKFYKPEWMEKAFKFCEQNPEKGAVIFLDELNRIYRQDLIPPVFQMALDFRLHTYEFPENLHVIVAANPDTANYKVLKFRDEAFYDRFCHVKFDPSKEEWFEYARSQNIHPEILSFLIEQPEYLEQSGLDDFDISQYVAPSRRTWLRQVDKLYKIGTPKNLIVEIASGLTGTKALVAWQEHLNKAEKPIQPEKIMNSYKSVQKLIKEMSNFESKEVRIDILKTTCDNLSAFLVSNYDIDNGGKIFSPTNTKNIAQFMMDLPGELAFHFAHKTGDKCTQLITLLNENEQLLKLLEATKGGTKVEETSS